MNSYTIVPSTSEHILDTTGNLYVVLPESTVNYITNPSFEVSESLPTRYPRVVNSTTTLSEDITVRGVLEVPAGVVLEIPSEVVCTVDVACSRVASREHSFFGRYGLQVLPDENIPASITPEDDFWGVFISQAISSGLYTLSVYYKGVRGDSEMTLSVKRVSTSETYYSINEDIYRHWKRASTEVNLPASDTYEIRYDSQGEFYLDGQQLEDERLTTYCDGDQDGCYWAATSHQSRSIRRFTRKGGQEVSLFDIVGLSIQEITNYGITTVEHATTAKALGDGSVYVSTRFPPRVFQITGTLDADTFLSLRDRMESVVDLVNPHLTRRPEEITFLWRDYNSPEDETKIFQASYVSGLEGDISSLHHMQLKLVLRAHFPYFKSIKHTSIDVGEGLIPEDNGDGSATTWYENIDGDWTKLEGCKVKSIVEGVNGNVFASFGNVVKKYKSSTKTWTEVGNISSTGLSNIVINSISVLTDEDSGADSDIIYAVGCHSTSPTRPLILMYDSSGWSIEHNDTSSDGEYTRILAGTWDSNFYIIGTHINGLWVWDIYLSTLTEVAGGPSAVPTFLELGADGGMYIGGDFTSPGKYIVSYNEGEWETFNADFPDKAVAMTVLEGNEIIAATEIDGTGGATNELYRYTGSYWKKILILLGDSGAVDLSSKGTTLYVSGDFTYTIIDAVYYFSNNGGTILRYQEWERTKIRPETEWFYAQKEAGGMLFAEFTGSTTARRSKTVTITNNGTVPTRPIIEWTGSGYLFGIYNRQTGDALMSRCNYDLLKLTEGEVLTIKLLHDERRIYTNIRPSVIKSIIPGSGLSDWFLFPGENKITIFGKGDVTVRFQELFDTL
jgi:hypothetical protein